MTGLRWTEDQLREHQAKALGRTRMIDRDSEARTSGSARDRGLPPAQSSLGPAAGEQVGGKSPRKIKRPEQELHKAAIKFLDRSLPPSWRVIHAGNGGIRSPIEAAIMVGLGVRKGFPDLLMLGPGRFVVGEAKASNGKLSRDQEEWRDWFISIGAPWFVFRSIDELIAGCVDAGVPLRGRLA